MQGSNKSIAEIRLNVLPVQRRLDLNLSIASESGGDGQRYMTVKYRVVIIILLGIHYFALGMSNTEMNHHVTWWV